MSKFGDLINGTETVDTVETPVVEEAPVVDTAPASVEEPVDPEPIDFGVLSKDELEIMDVQLVLNLTADITKIS